MELSKRSSESSEIGDGMTTWSRVSSFSVATWAFKFPWVSVAEHGYRLWANVRDLRTSLGRAYSRGHLAIAAAEVVAGLVTPTRRVCLQTDS